MAVVSNPVTNTDRSRESRRKRKKKSITLSLHQSQIPDHHQIQNQVNNNRWRTATEQQNYSAKFLQALRHVRTEPPSSSNPASSSSVPKRSGRAIREAADRVLAITAKGKSRWSRAILTNRLRLKFLKAKKPKVVIPTSRTRKPRLSMARRPKAKNLLAVQKKVRKLGTIMPGCSDLPLPDILEEAHDYISALEMQVRAMTVLAELLTVAGSLHPPRPIP